MTRFVSIATVLAETAAHHGRRPTAEQYVKLEDAFRKKIVIDLETGKAGIYYEDGFVGDPATFVESELTRPWIEIRSAQSAASDFAADL